MNLRIRVLPSAKQTQIVEEKGNYLKIKLHSPAREGKANKELIEVLADKFKVSKSRVEIIKGLAVKDKVVRIY
ncbi:MAG: hypothetical protein A2663_00695 [Candidatus Buchananbacteria bacterium RIFCSPHIGHO2_01_FULL_46_12]|uniref:UPF0235 protein A2663_00695 n=3 Tax=Candidatus Buchananiibacteriota TaxID=1817903 RepID=A0A1G1Y148_9BACT|nr:MAG: hypothetical protein A2663_00695 [Candidatus Buchananbacteria bacterium RIFCSPHIGHO2_01_FULL_46_12]OGY52991.1 MAG: hypothetical protein A3B15_03055 [Candidatus Buchananbacteria bacterium RIFCSPLOWO2_01_FULL_45_31]OGY56447.1 MAG: hypothetical protein A3H67_05265 [Candidatus Buchananbacteria bacterium RIFCSPLOWO2_02_FULL_46_11b]